MNKRLRGCLVVFAGFFALCVALAIVAGVSHDRADANAKELCASIPIGSTVESAQAIARRPPSVHGDRHRFAFHGVLFHQASCDLNVSDGVVTKKQFQTDDY